MLPPALRLLAGIAVFGLSACSSNDSAGVSRSPTMEAPAALRPEQALPATPPMPTPAHPKPWERVFAPPSQVLATGEPVQFKVCTRVTAWSKPTQEEMEPVFTDRRFGDGVKPRPLDYVLYLSRYFYVSTPTANSANKDINAFSGFLLGPDQKGTIAQYCDYAALYRSAVGTPTGKDGRLPPFQSFRVAGHHVVDMKRIGDQLVILVAAAPDSWEDVIFPYPPAPGFFETSVGLSAIEVMSDAGVLFRWQREAYVAWSEDWQYEDDGRLRYLEIAGATPLVSTPIEAPQGVSLVLLPGSLRANNEPFPAGVLTVHDVAGREVARRSWAAQTSEWHELGRISLDSGTYSLTLEVPNDTPASRPGGQSYFYRHFVLIRDDIPLP